MHDQDQDIKDLMQTHIPDPSPDLADRIIAQAMADGSGQKPEIQTGGGFSAWWENFKWRHGEQAAAIAIMVCVLVIVVNPAGKATEYYIEKQEKYTVEGVPLLADVELAEEPELELEVLLAQTDS